VVAVSEDDADSKVGIAVELAIGQCQLGQHCQVGGISFVNPVQAHKQDAVSGVRE
jgi:hypothetical protein